MMTGQLTGRARTVTHIFRGRAEIGWGVIFRKKVEFMTGLVEGWTLIPGPKLTATTWTDEGLTAQRRVTEAGVSPQTIHSSLRKRQLTAQD